MTTATPAMRERYLADSISTASPAKLLVMLFDRLVLDLTRGARGRRARPPPRAPPHHPHARLL
jgi:flagellar protein FliS